MFYKYRLPLSLLEERNNQIAIQKDTSTSEEASMLREWLAGLELGKACYANQNDNHFVNAVY